MTALSSIYNTQQNDLFHNCNSRSASIAVDMDIKQHTASDIRSVPNAVTNIKPFTVKASKHTVSYAKISISYGTTSALRGLLKGNG
jgi:hypothetical protein